MKNWFKKITILLFSGAALSVSSCDEGDAIVDQVTAETERGAILRTVNLISNELPIGDDSGNFTVELEVQDSEDGELVNQVEVYVGFRDNTEEIGPGTNVEETLFATISSTTFTNGPFGLPRFTYSATLPDMLAHVKRTNDDITGGDQFAVRFELILTDGRRFSFADNTGTLTGSFFSSPFLYTPTVICPIPEDLFIGDYQLTVAPTSAVGGVPIWNDQMVTISIGETSTERVFSAIYLEDLAIGNGPAEFKFNLVCGEIIPLNEQASGLQCENGITLGPPVGDDVTLGTYDITDDSTFTIVFAEDESGDCGGSATNATATLTKI